MSGMSSYFVAAQDQPRVRRAADAVGLGLGWLLAVWGATNTDKLTYIEEQVVEVVRNLPNWTIKILEFLYLGGALFAIAMVIGMLLTGRRHKRFIDRAGSHA